MNYILIAAFLAGIAHSAEIAPLNVETAIEKDANTVSVKYRTQRETFALLEPNSEWNQSRLHAAETLMVGKYFDRRVAGVLSNQVWPGISGKAIAPPASAANWEGDRNEWIKRLAALKDVEKDFQGVKFAPDNSAASMLHDGFQAIFNDYALFGTAFIGLADTGDCTRFFSELKSWMAAHTASSELLSLACADPHASGPTTANRSHARIHANGIWFLFTTYLATHGYDFRIDAEQRLPRESQFGPHEESGD